MIYFHQVYYKYRSINLRRCPPNRSLWAIGLFCALGPVRWGGSCFGREMTKFCCVGCGLSRVRVRVCLAVGCEMADGCCWLEDGLIGLLHPNRGSWHCCWGCLQGSAAWLPLIRFKSPWKSCRNCFRYPWRRITQLPIKPVLGIALRPLWSESLVWPL